MRILICEDNELFIQDLRKEILNCPCNEEIVFESYTNGKGLERKVDMISYDIAFIAMYIDGYSNSHLCEYLKEVQPNCHLIIINDNYTCIKDAFRLRARQLILRHEPEIIKEEFERILEEYKQENFEVVFHTNTGSDVSLKPSEIIYIQSDKRHTQVVTTMGVLHGRFDDLLKVKEQLKKYFFFQVHSHYFINVDHILLIKKGCIGIDNGDFVPTSVFNYQVTREVYQIYMRSL